MPYLLSVRKYLGGEFAWSDHTYPDDLADEAQGQLGYFHGTPFPTDKTVDYAQADYGKGDGEIDDGTVGEGKLTPEGLLPDLMPGRFSSDVLVSRRVKQFLDENDIVRHHYLPVRLHLLDGSVSEDQFFIFRTGDLTDAIVESESNLARHLIHGVFRYYAEVKQPVFVAWNAKSIEGRMIWKDRLLPGRLFISDAFKRFLEKNSMKRYYLDPSGIAQAH